MLDAETKNHPHRHQSAKLTLYDLFLVSFEIFSLFSTKIFKKPPVETGGLNDCLSKISTSFRHIRYWLTHATTRFLQTNKSSNGGCNVCTLCSGEGLPPFDMPAIP